LFCDECTVNEGVTCLEGDLLLLLLLLFFAVLVFELRAFTLSHSTIPIFVKGFSEIGSHELFARLASNCNPPDLSLLPE
jgi:hypothetical protein